MTNYWKIKRHLGKVMTCHICLQPLSNCSWYIEGITIFEHESKICQVCAIDYFKGPGEKRDSITHKILEVLE